MNRVNDLVLDLRVGGHTVRDNLSRAVAAGTLIEAEDGTLRFSTAPSRAPYLQVRNALRLPCHFRNQFLFRLAYAGAAVPFGCRSCYKVKAAPPTFRGLIALRGLLEQAPYHSKCGMGGFGPHARGLYAAYLYLEGLPAARAAWRDFRARLDAHPDLGPTVPLVIKRGCSNFEMACGRSDRWSFADGLAAVEDVLAARFRRSAAAAPPYRIARAAIMPEWVRHAHAIGDDTYLDVTGGRPLFPPTLTYSPEEPAEESPGSGP
jgi:hypothetical protein